MPRDDLAELDHPSGGSTRLPPPNFAHLRILTDEKGLWEHARYAVPRREHGFCNDDNARALVIVARENGNDLSDLATIYLRFVLDARKPDGHFHNRRLSNGSWNDDTGSDDSQGRAWWGLGATTRFGPEVWMRVAGLEEFDSCASFESPHLRANAYAALGAADVIERNPGCQPALDLLDRTSALIAGAARSAIPWPESRLTYDNPRIPEALIAAGSALGDKRRTDLGIRLLRWLIESESKGRQFSFTPVTGRTPGDREPAFDQQPIEAWAMADACYRASAVTRDRSWDRWALNSAAWLLGKNDSGSSMYEEHTGGTFDGLTPTGVNQNQGAESTLAGLGTLQIAVSLQRDRRLV